MRKSNTSQAKKERAVHRPISVIVETIDKLPYERTLPTETQLTINLKFTRAMAQDMILFLEQGLKTSDVEYVALTITGLSP